MSIEDIDHLIANSELASLTIVIDSKERDMNAFPTPAYYSIPFDEPIKNVVGFEILDASIPVTEFSIDKHNNKLAIGYILNNIGHSTEQACNTFSNILQYSTMIQELFENTSDANFFVYSDFAEFDAVPNTIDDASYNLLVYYTNGMISTHWDESLPFTLTLNGKTYYTDQDYTGCADVNVEKGFIYYIRYITDNDAALLAQNCNQANEEKSLISDFDFLMSNLYLEIPIRNYSSDKLYTLFNTAFLVNDIVSNALGEGEYIRVEWEDPVDEGDLSLTQRYIWRLKTTRAHAFYLDMSKSTCRTQLGFSEFNQLAFTSKLKYKTNQRLFLSTSTSPDQNFNQLIYTPGIIALEGVRYVELHCPEIESHILGSYSSFKQTPGVGLFKLIDSNTITHLRFDFLNIVRKPFHPIGKLSRLTLSFVNRSEKQLYNFKGVDHTILLSIKYYAPKQSVRNANSVLNKMYEPDILSYKLRFNKEKEEEPQYLEDILRHQKKYFS